jgi:hypothetical protein
MVPGQRRETPAATQGRTSRNMAIARRAGFSKINEGGIGGMGEEDY